MGQYYHPTCIDKMESLSSHDFGNGSKLMEHSYIGNRFMEAVEHMLSPEGPWHKTRFCWAGDYMDNDLFLDGVELTPDEEGDIPKTLYQAGRNLNPFTTPDYNSMNYDERDAEINRLADEWFATLPKRGRFLVNHTKELCIDLEKVKAFEKYEGSSWAIHPLSLLTCSGNGRGGGDFSKDRDKGFPPEQVGEWAGDVISLEYEPKYVVIDPTTFKPVSDEELKEYDGLVKGIGLEKFEEAIS